MRAEFRPFYGWHWRTVVRPRALLRAGGRFSDELPLIDGETPKGKYLGGAKCQCGCGEVDPIPLTGRSKLEAAHLDQTPGHDDDDNICMLAHSCHRRHDYTQWAEEYGKFVRARKAQAIAAADAARPILQLLEEVRA